MNSKEYLTASEMREISKQNDTVEDIKRDIMSRIKRNAEEGATSLTLFEVHAWVIDLIKEWLNELGYKVDYNKVWDITSLFKDAYDMTISWGE